MSLKQKGKSMKRVVSIALAALAVAILAGAAAAEDSKSYNGSYCKAFFGGDTGNLVHGRNGMFNSAGFAISITCPIVVDQVANTGGTGTTQPCVHWTANTASDRLSCTLFSMNADGNVRQSQFADKTGSGWLIFANLTTDDKFGSYSIVCSLPGRGTVNTLWIAERD
jgi:hypothetical protein